MSGTALLGLPPCVADEFKKIASEAAKMGNSEAHRIIRTRLCGRDYAPRQFREIYAIVWDLRRAYQEMSAP